ncbi:MAG: FAD-dependent oxidoreductase [Oscillospiraceae bacterium]|nr:FAD-dependent oxidoreductase [Oscillospiraceae bacterium]
MAKYGAGVHSVYDMPHDGEIVRHGLEPGRTVTEARRETAVIRDVDVIVVGGGPGGVAAAVTAARNGARTVLLERYGHLGGMATGGLVNIIPNLSDISGRQWLGGFCQEFIDRMAARGAADFPPKEKWGSDDAALVEKYSGAGMGHFYIRENGEGKKISLYTAVIDPEVGKDELARMAEEAGAELLLHTWAVAPIIEGNTVRGVLTESKAGRQALLGKAVIDATGDGDLLMNTPTETVDHMRPGSRIAQFGFVYWICGVDLEAYDAFAEAHGDELNTIREKIMAEGGLPFFCRGLLEHQRGVVWVHRLIGSLHQTEPEEMTYIDSSARHTAVRTWELFKKYMPGFRNSFIMLSAPQLGTSGGRRIVGEYYLTEEDMDRDEPYPDTIAIFPDNDRGAASLLHPKTFIPYRALLPKDVEGLLVACRAFSADHEFSEFFNLIPHCMCFGQAAGAAAAIAVRKGTGLKEVPYGELREALLAGGAILPE